MGSVSKHPRSDSSRSADSPERPRNAALRITVLTAVAVIAVIVCALLSRWQWNRAVDRADANERIENTTEVVALDTVLEKDADLADEDRWVLVEATGTYAEEDVIVRLRSNQKKNGYEVVTPLLLDDGSAVLVNRGFTESLDDIPEAPEGEVTVDGRLYESEPDGGGITERDGHTQARRINTAELSQETGLNLREGYIGRTETTDELRPIAAPAFKDWMNFSYAGQWALFALMMPVGWFILVRKELRGESTLTRGSRGERGKRPRVDRDAFEEAAGNRIE